MRRKIKRVLGTTIAIVFVKGMAATLVIGNFFIRYALIPNQGAEERAPATDVLPQGVESQKDSLESTIHNHRQAEFKATEKWYEAVKVRMEKVRIKSEEGHTLTGHTYLQPEKSAKWAVLVHGYQGTEEGMHPTARHYYEAGYNIFTYSQRAMDESEGEYITMGIKESEDLLLWLEALLTAYPDAHVVTHGVSMGAATVLIASGQANFPDAVQAVIADCGYSRVWSVFESELYQRFQLPAFPFLHMAALVSILRVGMNLFSDEGDVAYHTSQSTTPTLFIHGTADDFVPYPMVDELYEAHPGERKECYIVEGAGHAEAQFLNPDDYFETIFRFIDRT